MPLSYDELEGFFEGLITRLRGRGVACAITSGMACVHYGVALATKDCDALCQPEAAQTMLNVLAETLLGDVAPDYRGNLSPPLDERWLGGGWTSHFVWKSDGNEAYFDVFGVPPRGSEPWEPEVEGLYAGRHLVGEMKRTDRDKDWPYATALGVKMLLADDPRGWWHIFSEEVMREMLRDRTCPPEIVARRPVLQLLLQNDARLRGALHAEEMFWHELDRVRIQIYYRAVRRYTLAVRKAAVVGPAALLAQHAIRIECAQQHLPLNPLREHGFDRLIDESRAGLKELLGSDAYFLWLPDVRAHFISLLS